MAENPNDPTNSAIKVLKSPLVITILGVIVMMTPAIMGWLPANATLAAVILAGLKLIAYVYKQLDAQNTAIGGAADVAVANAQAGAANPPTP